MNNAGIAGPTAPLVDVTPEEWNETIAVNLTGVFLACKAALPYLQRSEHGKILNIGSVTGKQPLPNRSPYAAAKLGVVGLTRTLAHEVGPDNISVNLISPWLVEGQRLGDVLSSMSKERGLTPDQLRAEMTEGTAFKRTVEEADVVEMAIFLCSLRRGQPHRAGHQRRRRRGHVLMACATAHGPRGSGGRRPLALVGCGGMGQRHLRAYAALRRIGRLGFELAAVCDPRREVAQRDRGHWPPRSSGRARTCSRTTRS